MIKKKDRYIIRKYVYAKSASEAIKLDSKYPVNDVWVDDDYKKDNEINSSIGYKG